MLQVEVYYDHENWRRVLNDFSNYDFGHTYDFHKISENNKEGKAVIFAVKNADDKYIMCWPALLRRVEDTEFYDLTSVLEFSGPLIEDLDILNQCMDVLLGEMRDRKIIALFAKMHPLMSIVKNTDDFPVQQIGNIVIIDVNKQRETIKTYRSNHKRDIRRALAAGVNVVVDECCAHMNLFMRMYHQAMAELGAREYYLFSRQYLENIASATDFKSFLMFAIYKNKLLGAIMILRTGKIAHYYLGGVEKKYKHLSPLKVLLASAHQWCIDNEMNYLVLGGGPGGLDGPLIHFKKGFSNFVLPSHCYRNILNINFYIDVCNMRGVDYRSTDFFPAYRKPL